MARTGQPLGRKPKPEGEKFKKRMLTFPPGLWEQVEAAIPEGQRAPFVAEAVRRALEEREGAEAA
jgi:hypothetical protein